ncbi:hypothetical protein Tco_0922935, partial [Tanacetum coccineum]
MEGYLYHHLIHKFTKLTTLVPTYGEEEDDVDSGESSVVGGDGGGGGGGEREVVDTSDHFK